MSTISLVTGGNRGIGREVCRQLTERGHTVLLTARSAAAACRLYAAAGPDEDATRVTSGPADANTRLVLDPWS